jgi:hypothetical protein
MSRDGCANEIEDGHQLRHYGASDCAGRLSLRRKPEESSVMARTPTASKPNTKPRTAGRSPNFVVDVPEVHEVRVATIPVTKSWH